MSRAWANDSYAYFSAGNGTFGVVDLTTGHFTKCGKQGGQTYAGPGVGAEGVLFAGAALDNAFGTISPTDGSFTLIGESNIRFDAVGSYQGVIYALAVDDGGMVDLYSVDQTSAVARFIGHTGAVMGGDNWPGLSTEADGLYMYFAPEPDQGKLYSLNLRNGHAKRLRGTPKRDLGPMTQVNGVLYIGVQDLPVRIDSFDFQTHRLTRVSVVHDTDNYLWGLAPASGVTCGR
jgi:hypothetical protein